jgi:hypothetical protein
MIRWDRWEHTVIRLETVLTSDAVPAEETMLSQMGIGGWELLHVHIGINFARYYFKRPLKLLKAKGSKKKSGVVTP